MPRIRIPSSFVMFGSLAVAACLATSPLAAQTNASDTARATELFKSGKAAFAKGDMVEAERLFSQALAIRKSSDIAANLGQSELEQQKYRLAAEHFAWALANLLPSATDAQRKAVETGLARARAEVAILRLEIKPDGSDVLVGAHPAGTSPIAGSIYVEPGEVIVSVKHDGFISIDKRIMAAKGTEQAVEVELNPKEGIGAPSAAPAPAPALVTSGLSSAGPSGSSPPSDRVESKSLVPAFVATGVAVAGGVVGLVFTLSANDKADEADGARDGLEALGGCDQTKPTMATPAACDDLQEQRESVDSSRNLAVGSFVVGGVAALVAGYFYWDALSHRGATARKAQPLYGLLPSVDVGRAGAARGVDSVKLSVSGKF